MTLHDLIQSAWPQSRPTPLSSLDTALVNWLHSQRPSTDPRHAWLAALTSHQWARGHACLDLQQLDAHAQQLLGWNEAASRALPSALSQAAASLPWAQGPHSPLVWVADQQLLYLRRAWLAEQAIRSNLQQRLAHQPALPADLDAALNALFPSSAPASQDRQRQACEVAMRHAITLITGGPGTGKTTTVVRLLALLVGARADTEAPLRIHLAAPTGKAAARLSESIAQAIRALPPQVQAHLPTQAHTLHRLLQVRGPTDTPAALASDVVVVDEASMIDLEMMAKLLQAVPLHARLVLLGDKDQLASVEAGAVMAQLCSGALLRQQTVTLTHSHRFRADSGIGQWAHAVNRDHNAEAVRTLWQNTPRQPAPSATPSANGPSAAASTSPDVTRIDLTHTHDPRLSQAVRQGWQDFLNLLAALRSPPSPASGCSPQQALAVLKALARFSVLCALREGPWGVVQLNRQIESALQLRAPNDAAVWYVGRPVMVTRNDYALELMNGDIGVCLPGPDGVLRVAFASAQADDGIRWVALSRLDSVETVFAMTVHKSQGSEFHHVLLVLPAQASPVLTRELVYTGLTRARAQLTWCVPQPEVLFSACAQRVIRSGGLALDPQ